MWSSNEFLIGPFFLKFPTFLRGFPSKLSKNLVLFTDISRESLMKSSEIDQISEAPRAGIGSGK